MWSWMGGLAAAALLLARPEAAADGARAAMAQWYHAVAPSLFPFMALLPLLTCDAAGAAYEKLLGGLTRRLYRLPGAAAPALAAGMLGGSPAGCAAARRVAANGGMTRGELQRLAIACCGLSPAFCISGIGAAMLQSPALGHRLLRAQVATQLLMPILLMPFCRDDAPAPPVEDVARSTPVLSILNVCGWMALFGAMAAALGDLLGDGWGKACLCLMDVTSGARVIASAALPVDVKVAALAALTGFGGLCVCAQNLSLLRGVVRPAAFVAARVGAGLLTAGFAALQTIEPPLQADPSPLHISCLCACVLLVPAMIKLGRTIF